MNLIRRDVRKIINIEKVITNNKVIDKFDLVKVSMIADINGVTTEVERIFDRNEWQLVLDHGYFLA
ncbi:MAG: hypothetical protein J6D47_00210 [Peptostreptococcaceae bacterium]|nr:hypothetical protein [Peptostreptococcaceae bacterium]